MSSIFVFLLIVGLFIIFAQFGGRLAARNALVWWMMGAFILISATAPDLLLPLTTLLGVQLVSNFVLGVMVFFLFFQAFELTSELSKHVRKQRTIVSSLAVDDFFEKNGDISKTKNESNLPKALLVFPCYNEQEAIESTISDIQNLNSSYDKDALTIDYCIVDDGSIDSSKAILNKKCPENFTSHRTNVGVAGVLITGFQIARRLDYDFIIQCDSDGQHPIQDVPKLVEMAKSKKMDLLIGSRFLQVDVNSSESTTQMRMLGIFVIRLILRIFGKSAAVFDPTSGFRVYSRKAVEVLLKNMPDEYPEPESIAILTINKLNIGEIPVKMSARSAGISSISGLKTIQFMIKVSTALLGLRLRSILSN